jgi:hypothetical protein
LADTLVAEISRHTTKDEAMDISSLFQQLGIALGLGLLVGPEFTLSLEFTIGWWFLLFCKAQ